MTVANKITVLRICLLPFFVLFLFLYSPEREWLRFAALGFCAAAGLSDMADGYLARRFGQHSRLGARLDPFADKLMLNLGFVFAAANANFEPGIPMWFPVVVLGRDAVLVLGCLFVIELSGEKEFRPRILGKLSTASQTVALLGVLLRAPFLDALVLAALVISIVSLGDYLYMGVRQYGRRGAMP